MHEKRWEGWGGVGRGREFRVLGFYGLGVLGF